MEIPVWQIFPYLREQSLPNLHFFNFGGRYKRIRRRPKGNPQPEHYRLQVEKLNELENLSRQDAIDLYYCDETHVCSEGYVPYGWQFPGEDVCFLSERGLADMGKRHKINFSHY
jgi:hypothetical protein